MKIANCYKQVYRTAVEAGWTVSVTGGGHLCWRSPSGFKVFSSKSPRSDDIHQHRRQLRRGGLKV